MLTKSRAVTNWIGQEMIIIATKQRRNDVCEKLYYFLFHLCRILESDVMWWLYSSSLNVCEKKYSHEMLFVLKRMEERQG